MKCQWCTLKDPIMIALEISTTAI